MSLVVVWYVHPKSTIGALPVKQRQSEAKTHLTFCIIIKVFIIIKVRADCFLSVSKWFEISSRGVMVQ